MQFANAQSPAALTAAYELVSPLGTCRRFFFLVFFFVVFVAAPHLRCLRVHLPTCSSAAFLLARIHTHVFANSAFAPATSRAHLGIPCIICFFFFSVLAPLSFYWQAYPAATTSLRADSPGPLSSSGSVAPAGSPHQARPTTFQTWLSVAAVHMRLSSVEHTPVIPCRLRVF